MTKKETEWREIVNVNSIELYRSDIIDLMKILGESNDDERPDIEMRISSNSKTVRIDPIQEDFINIGFESSNQVSITLKIWKDVFNDTKIKSTEIVSGISITMYENYVNYQIHSFSETWFLGKKEQLNKFFERKKPIFTETIDNYKIFKIINNLIFLVALGLVFYFLLNFKYFFTAVAAITVILTGIIPIKKTITTKTPYVMVYFSERPKPEKKVSKDIPWNLIINILTLIVAIVGLFVK